MNAKIYFKSCAVPQCRNTTVKTPEKVFVFVPRKQNVREQWLRLARRDPELVSPQCRMYFCEDHFDLPNDMENYIKYKIMGHVSQVRLRAGCLPSKFKWQLKQHQIDTSTSSQSQPFKRQRLDFEEALTYVEPRTNSGFACDSVHVEVVYRLLRVSSQDKYYPISFLANYIQYKIMGSVKRIRMKTNCIPSRFDCQTERERNLTPTRDDRQHYYKKTAVMPVLENIEKIYCMEMSTSCFHQDSDTSQTELEDPLNDGSKQCRFCGEFTQNFIVVNDEKSYIANNKTALTLNYLSVELDFENDTLPKTVCGDCDTKLQEMFDFVRQVKAAQDLLINVADDDMEETEIVVKVESVSPTPSDSYIVDDDNVDSDENNDNKDGIVDSLTVGETVLVKNTVFAYKRRSKKDRAETLKKSKATVNECEESELIVDIKEEVLDVDDNFDGCDEIEAGYSELSDTGPDIEPNELELAINYFNNKSPV